MKICISLFVDEACTAVGWITARGHVPPPQIMYFSRLYVWRTEKMRSWEVEIINEKVWPWSAEALTLECIYSYCGTAQISIKRRSYHTQAIAPHHPSYTSLYFQVEVLIHLKYTFDSLISLSDSIQPITSHHDWPPDSPQIARPTPSYTFRLEKAPD